MSTIPSTFVPWGLGRFLIEGAWRFILVSLVGFAPWVCAGAWLHAQVGEVGLYGACTLGFLIAAGLLLPALLQPHHLRRFLGFFVLAFVAYAVVWCTCWFALGAGIGEWLGSLVGSAVFVLITAWRIGRPRALLATLIIFSAVHAVGYFAGGETMRFIITSGQPRVIGMLAWGIWYGLGFGLGFGYLLHACQYSRPSTTPI